jgi:hypothetical protein
VKRIDWSLWQGTNTQGIEDRADIFHVNNCIYFGGLRNPYYNQSQGRAELFKYDKSGNLLWMKNYKVDLTAYTAPKFVFLKNAIYLVILSSYNNHNGINITKIDTASGNVIYSKNVELLSNPPMFYAFSKPYIAHLDSIHLLIACGYALVKFNVNSGSVVASAMYGLFPQFASFKTIMINSDYSIILSGFVDGGSSLFTMKIKNDNQLSFLDGRDFGNYYQLFKKDPKTFIGIKEENVTTFPNWFCEFDSSLNLTKCMIPNAQINTHTGGFLSRPGRIFMHNYDRDIIIDTAYNCLQSKQEYYPSQLSDPWSYNGFTGPMLFMNNGIYSIKTNSFGINWNKSLLVRSDTNFVDPCNTSTIPILFTPTTIPSVNVFTINVTQITPTVSIVNYTVISNVVTDSTYCTTTTDLTSNLISKPNLDVKYQDRNINLESTNVMKEVTVYDLYGREVKKVELNAQNFEIPYSSQPPGVYFVQVFYTDNSFSRVKILLR